MDQSVEEIWRQVVTLLTTYGLDVVGAVAILIAGWIGAGWVRRWVARALARVPKVDQTLRPFFASLARYLVLVFTGFAVLSQFGIQTASLLAVFGAAGLAIGLAVQGTLSNVAAGVMLMLFRPFKIGDYIEAGDHAGTVRAITLFITEMATPDNVQIIVPNAQIWGTSVKNYSRNPTRRIDIAVGIGYGDDIDAAIAAILDEAVADSRAHADPEPVAAVIELADNSVNLTVRVWCDRGDYGSLKFDLTKAVKQRLDKEGISIPFPQRDVHLIQGAA